MVIALNFKKWTVLQDLFSEGINLNFEKVKLATSQTEGIIACLPKT